jgi:hypothetical protein
MSFPDFEDDKKYDSIANELYGRDYWSAGMCNSQRMFVRHVYDQRQDTCHGQCLYIPVKAK